MPWKARWNDERETTVIIRPSDPWEWDDLDATVEEYHRWVAAKDYPCTAIFHIGDRIKVPRPSLMRRTQVYMNQRPENLKLVVMAEAPPILNRIIEMGASLFGVADEIAFVDTLDEALALAEQVHQHGEPVG